MLLRIDEWLRLSVLIPILILYLFFSFVSGMQWFPLLESSQRFTTVNPGPDAVDGAFPGLPAVRADIPIEGDQRVWQIGNKRGVGLVGSVLREALLESGPALGMTVARSHTWRSDSRSIFDEPSEFTLDGTRPPSPSKPWECPVCLERGSAGPGSRGRRRGGWRAMMLLTLQPAPGCSLSSYGHETGSLSGLKSENLGLNLMAPCVLTTLLTDTPL
jgi:hypothetical protein